MVARPAKFQNATKQTQEPPPPLPHSRPVTPQPLPTSVALTFVVLVGLACAVVANAKPATRKTTAMQALIRPPPCSSSTSPAASFYVLSHLQDGCNGHSDPACEHRTQRSER